MNKRELTNCLYQEKRVMLQENIFWKRLRLNKKIFIGYQTFNEEFCIVNREFSDLRCLMFNTLELVMKCGGNNYLIIWLNDYNHLSTIPVIPLSLACPNNLPHDLNPIIINSEWLSAISPQVNPDPYQILPLIQKHMHSR